MIRVFQRVFGMDETIPPVMEKTIILTMLGMSSRPACWGGVSKHCLKVNDQVVINPHDDHTLDKVLELQAYSGDICQNPRRDERIGAEVRLVDSKHNEPTNPQDQW